MTRDLTQSAIDRQNILNNSQAIDSIQTKLGLSGLHYNEEYKFTTKMVMDFYEVSRATISRYIANHQDELSHNGYQVLKGQKLKEFKSLFGHLIAPHDDSSQSITDDTLSDQTTDHQSISRIKALAVFNFRAVLNLGMLLTESEKAKQVRSLMLDVVIDTINKRIGGSTKYINQREEDFLIAIAREPIYRKEFTSALSQHLDMGPMKYSIYTDAIYNAIFKENAKEYKAILRLEEKDNPRDTMYADVLKLIASFEIGLADEIRDEANKLERKLRPSELNILIDRFSNKRQWIPLIDDARAKMASRDYGLRNIIHQRLQKYIGALSHDDYTRFLGDRSKDLIERVLENPQLIDVFKRLKDR
ncbi:DNA-binding protein [Algoriphagus sp. NF]|uniref:DNA-binding protein n=1 Tax=Algoriphagus sp. NF TaxID=2992756 RepID=UPI00237A6E19|nr:DNA-binding protein [Algoriphagus sp. NF]MDE0561562.1 DNA-binding protein [Algoriphagus sp. NF]